MTAWKLVKADKKWTYKGKEFVVGKFSRVSGKKTKAKRAVSKKTVKKSVTKRKIAKPRSKKPAVGGTQDIIMSLAFDGDHDSMGPKKRARVD